MSTLVPVVTQRPSNDRFYSQVYENIDPLDLAGHGFMRVLFRNCRIVNLRGTKLVNCTFRNCRLDVSDPRGIIGCTMTYDCKSFSGLKCSPESIDAFLYLVASGCRDKDQQDRIHAAIDQHRLRVFKRIWNSVAIA